ncbi:hypothetical protein FH972_025964 [Carpinus fangiana]|uniref:Uncharacterized protein n=1 Tax=Carpinus fangiana TaxID=176857 RepID=A0A5N6L2J1_9ROSI|nr:hypothetical protein FH972_025964 [Carpinus fangiana]
MELPSWLAWMSGSHQLHGPPTNHRHASLVSSSRAVCNSVSSVSREKSDATPGQVHNQRSILGGSCQASGTAAPCETEVEYEISWRAKGPCCELGLAKP